VPILKLGGFGVRPSQASHLFKTMAKTKRQFNKEYYEEHKPEILAKRKLTRKAYGQKQYSIDKAKARVYWRRWYSNNAALYLGKKRLQSRTPEGIQKGLERLYRFIERHPEISECYLEACERWIRMTERNVALYERIL
jgi:hypothetical protein